jgi:hypothetical protein
MIPFNPHSPMFKAFQLWRKYVSLAKEGDANSDIFQSLSCLYQMQYVTEAALVIAKEESR